MAEQVSPRVAAWRRQAARDLVQAKSSLDASLNDWPATSGAGDCRGRADAPIDLRAAVQRSGKRDGAMLAAQIRHRVRDEKIARLRDVAAKLASAGGIEEVRLFGSLARGDGDGRSDADILILTEPDTGAANAAMSFKQADDPVDIVSLPASEYERFVAAGHPFYAPIARESMLLWSKPDVQSAKPLPRRST